MGGGVGGRGGGNAKCFPYLTQKSSADAFSSKLGTLLSNGCLCVHVMCVVNTIILSVSLSLILLRPHTHATHISELLLV